MSKHRFKKFSTRFNVFIFPFFKARYLPLPKFDSSLFLSKKKREKGKKSIKKRKDTRKWKASMRFFFCLWIKGEKEQMHF